MIWKSGDEYSCIMFQDSVSSEEQIKSDLCKKPLIAFRTMEKLLKTNQCLSTTV
jgi:hypothetical protein